MTNDILTALRPAFVLLLLFAVLTGIAYPFAITGAAQLAMPAQANGSLLRDGDRVVGSTLIGQVFAAPGYFHGRPSAAGDGYNASASSGSNLGPASQVLADRIGGDVAGLRKDGVEGPIPADSVTTSGSGLDPHISPETALLQAPRIAAARKLPVERVRALIAENTEGVLLGFIGEPRVNVLLINRQLDAASSVR